MRKVAIGLIFDPFRFVSKVLMTLHRPRSRMDGDVEWVAIHPCPTPVRPFAPLIGDSHHFVAHTGTGLEKIAAEEIAEHLHASPIVILQGKVVFRTDALFSTVRQLRSVESVSLLCWAAMTPKMPDEFEAFKLAFQALLAEHVVPTIGVLGRAWCEFEGLADADSVAFRVTARRGGNDSACVTRHDLARWLAEAWHDESNGVFVASARDYSLDIRLQWSASQVCIELPCTAGSTLSIRPYAAVPTIHAPIGWFLSRIALCELSSQGSCGPPPVVLDPMVGHGGLLVEAALSHPHACFVGSDRNAEQLAGAVANVKAARLDHAIALLRGDATALPLADKSVDAVLTDLPFGRKHGKKDGLYNLVLAEANRVLRDGGLCVMLTTCKKEFEQALEAGDAGDWIKESRHHLMIGALRACAFVLRRRKATPPCPVLALAAEVAATASLRALFAASGVSGPCPLDCDSLELALFAVGWDHLYRDLSILLKPSSLKIVEAILTKHGVRNAIACRDNLVNYKKALLGIYQSSLLLSHELRRLATFFREPPEASATRTQGGRGYVRPEPYTSLSDALCTTEGGVGSLLDGRKFVKAVCCLPRHPDARKEEAAPQHGQPVGHYRCAGLLSEALPEAFKSWRLLKDARDAIHAASKAAEASDSSLADYAKRLDAVMAAAKEEIETIQSYPLYPQNRKGKGWPSLLSDLSATKLTPMEVWLTRCVLIARGGAKALIVTAVARRLARVMARQLDACEECEAIVVEAAEATRDAANAPLSAAEAAANAATGRLGHPSVRFRVVARKHSCILGGMRRALMIVQKWLETIAHSDDAKVLFVGADADGARIGCVHFAPSGFDALTRLFDVPRGLAREQTLAMVQRIEKDGWPEWITAAARDISDAENTTPGLKKRGPPPCSHCGLRHAATWMRDGVCCGCEHRVRREGRCPFGKGGCTPHAWCVHSNLCLLCDRHSCAECRFHQGDGHDVAVIAGTLRPSHLYVDFDRTLCSTRGGSPLNGHHSIDEELLSVISQFVGEKGNAAVQVVTRNAHVDDIKTFLARSGLGDVGVTRIARPRSKAEVVAAKGGVEGEVALFVDDTISEHLDEEMRAAVGVVRFLFVRSL